MNFLKRKHFDYLIALLAYFVVALIVLSPILLSPGTVGFYHDWFIGPYQEMNKSWANEGLYKWNSQIGNKIYDSDWIIRLILFPIPFLGGEVLSKGLLIFIITTSGFGSYCLARRLKLSWYACFAAGILYIFTPIIFTKIIAGHLYYLIAYSLTPFIVVSFFKGNEENNSRYYIIAGLLLSVAVIQLQFLVMVFLILLTFTLIDFQKIRKNIIGLLITFSITFLITFSPLLLPQIFVGYAEIPFKITQLLSYDALTISSDFAETFRMLGYEVQPYSYLNLGTTKDQFASNAGIIPSWIFYVDYLLPIAGFSILLFKRDKYTISFAAISLIGIYLMKGPSSPFPAIFTFLFIHGLYIFRELWHIAFLYGFSITFLIALVIERIQQSKKNQLIRFGIPFALVCMIVISNGFPLLLGNFAGYLQTYDFPSEYRTLYKKLTSNPNNNVLILPYVNPVRFDNLTLDGIDPLITYTSTMIFPSVIGYRESVTIPLSIWLLSTIQENRTDNLGKVLSGLGIKYVVLRKDFVSTFANHTPMVSIPTFREKWDKPLEPVLDSQKDMKIISNIPQYKIYENLNKASKIFVPFTSVGGLSNYDSLLLISNLTSLSNVAVYPSISEQNSLIFVESKREANLSINDFFDIGRYANSFDGRYGWTDNINSFGYDHILASRTHQGLFSEASNSDISFELPNNYKNKEVEIWMKALSWEQGGAIDLQTDPTKYSISLFSPANSFQLFKIFEGELDTSYPISLKNIQGKNYVEGFYIKQKNLQNINAAEKIILTDLGDQAPNLVLNSGFSLADNQSALPLYWNDSGDSCLRIFTCKVNNTDGWNDKKSFQLFTKYPHNRGIWSMIQGRETEVKPNEQYQVLTHMKLNKWTTRSSILLQGYNDTSKIWYQVQQCPPGTNGPLKWQGFSCTLTIPENTSKIRPVLKAGWSPDLKKASKTWFDAISIIKLKSGNEFPSMAQVTKPIAMEIAGNSSSTTSSSRIDPIMEFSKINPTLWNVHINTSKPITIAFAEPYDQMWQAVVFKNDKIIDVVNSSPLYGAINAFEIRPVGDLDITLSFAPQYWHQIGLVIAGITFTFCIFYIIFESRKTIMKSAT